MQVAVESGVYEAELVAMLLKAGGVEAAEFWRLRELARQTNARSGRLEHKQLPNRTRSPNFRCRASLTGMELSLLQRRHYALCLEAIGASSMISPEEKQQLAAAREGVLAVADSDGAVRQALERLQQLEQEREEREVAALAEALQTQLNAAAVTYFPAESGLAAPVPGTGGQFLAVDDVVLLRDGLPSAQGLHGAVLLEHQLCSVHYIYGAARTCILRKVADEQLLDGIDSALLTTQHITTSTANTTSTTACVSARRN